MKIGLISEEKFPPDKRVVFTPKTCVKTVKEFPEIEFFIEKSDIRCFSNKEYLAKGFPVVDDVSNCDILIGVKACCPDSAAEMSTRNFRRFFSKV